MGGRSRRVSFGVFWNSCQRRRKAACWFVAYRMAPAPLRRPPPRPAHLRIVRKTPMSWMTAGARMMTKSELTDWNHAEGNL